MNLVEYKNIVVQRLNKTISGNSKESMSYGCMGLIEETGEIIAELRKPLFKGNFHEKTLDLQNINSELGDLIWYIALMCENCNIDIQQIEKYETNKYDMQLPIREELIQIAIDMGKTTGEIVEESLRIKDDNKEKLSKKLSEQYNNVNQLANLLGIKINDILQENIKKINSRYNEKGDVNR